MGGESQIDWNLPYWKQDISKGTRVFNNAVITHIITAKHATQLLLKNENGIILEITDGVGYHYRGNIFYSLTKISTNHLALAYAEELKNTGITSIALTPGFLRSEEMLDNFGVKEENWRDAIKSHPHFAGSETPYYIGRCVVSLATDPQVKRFNGQALSTWELSKIYDFRDIDGSKPDWEYFHRMYEEGKIDPETWRY